MHHWKGEWASLGPSSRHLGPLGPTFGPTWPQGAPFCTNIARKCSPRVPPDPARTLRISGFNKGKRRFAVNHLFQQTRPKMLSEGPQGSQITPLGSLLGSLWHHLGSNLVPFGPQLALPGAFGCPKSPPKPPKVTPFGTKAHQRVPKVAQDGPQDLILHHFGSFWESF